MRNNIAIAVKLSFGQSAHVVTFFPLSWDEAKVLLSKEQLPYDVVTPVAELELRTEQLLAFPPTASDSVWTPTENLTEQGGFLRWYKVSVESAHFDAALPVLSFKDWSITDSQLMVLSIVEIAYPGSSASRLFDSETTLAAVGLHEESYAMVVAPGLAPGVTSIAGKPVQESEFAEWWLVKYQEVGLHDRSSGERAQNVASSAVSLLTRTGEALITVGSWVAVVTFMAYPPNLLSMATFWLFCSRKE
jgi:hypothetical protein